MKKVYFISMSAETLSFLTANGISFKPWGNQYIMSERAFKKAIALGATFERYDWIFKPVVTTSITDFRFERCSGYGRYKVSYTSPKTGKTWKAVITDGVIIDKTWHEEDPKVKDLNELKKLVKFYAE